MMKRRPEYDVDGEQIFDTMLGFDGEWEIIDRVDLSEDVGAFDEPEASYWLERIVELQFNPTTGAWREKSTGGRFAQHVPPEEALHHEENLVYIEAISERDAVSWWIAYGDTPSAIRNIVAKEFEPEIAEFASRLKPNVQGNIVRYLAKHLSGVTMEEFLEQGLTTSSDPEDVKRALRRISNGVLLDAELEIVIKPKIRIKPILGYDQYEERDAPLTGDECPF